MILRHESQLVGSEVRRWDVCRKIAHPPRSLHLLALATVWTDVAAATVFVSRALAVVWTEDAPSALFAVRATAIVLADDFLIAAPILGYLQA